MEGEQETVEDMRAQIQLVLNYLSRARSTGAPQLSRNMSKLHDLVATQDEAVAQLVGLAEQQVPHTVRLVYSVDEGMKWVYPGRVAASLG